MSTHRNPAERESPIEGHTVKSERTVDGPTTQGTKTAGRRPRQESARQPQERDSAYNTTSHKSIFRLTGFNSDDRMDSREDIYSALDAWAGQSHE